MKNGILISVTIILCICTAAVLYLCVSQKFVVDNKKGEHKELCVFIEENYGSIDMNDPDTWINTTYTVYDDCKVDIVDFYGYDKKVKITKEITLGELVDIRKIVGSNITVPKEDAMDGVGYTLEINGEKVFNGYLYNKKHTGVYRIKDILVKLK